MQEITPEMINSELSDDIQTDPLLFVRVLEQKKLRAEELKLEGDEHFKRKDFKSAIELYKDSYNIISVKDYNIIDSRHRIKQEILDLTKRLLKNASQCYIGLEKWDEGLEMCKVVNKIDPNDLKTYYRAGLCLKNKGKLEESYAKLEEGTKVVSTEKMDPLYIKLKNEVAKQLIEDRKKQKEMFSRVLGQKSVEVLPEEPASSIGTESLRFALLGGIMGGISYLALQSLPEARCLKEEEKIAISSAVGSGIGGLSVSKRTSLKFASATAIFGGLGWFAYKFLKEK